MPTTDPMLMQWTNFAFNPTTWIDITINFLVALLYAAIVSFIYRQCRGLHTNRSFIQTLYMLTLVIALVMMVIMGVRGTAAVAVAFGLMGALSIIRFRTVVKDNRDTAFVFLAVGVGMAAGTGMWWIGFIGLGMIGMVLLIAEITPWGRSRQRVIAKITIRPTSGEGGGDPAPNLSGALAQLGNNIQMMHVRTMRFGEQMEITYALTLNPHVEPPYVAQQLLKLNGVDGVNLFNPDEVEEP